MRWMAIVVVVVLVGGACQRLSDTGGAANAEGQAQPTQASSQPECREFTAPVTAADRPEQASGRACKQPDGSWRVVQNTPGLPTQEYVFPRPEQTPPPAQTASTEPTPSQAPPACTTYTVPVTVGGQPEQAIVEACPQADGSWRITQTTPGLPPQVYDVPPPAYAPYSYDYAYAYPDYFPYWWGAPWFFGLAPSIVVVQRFHHFHHGFGHGFMHGMHAMHAMHGFFHGGFTAARGGAMGGGHR